MSLCFFQERDIRSATRAGRGEDKARDSSGEGWFLGLMHLSSSYEAFFRQAAYQRTESVDLWDWCVTDVMRAV